MTTTSFIPNQNKLQQLVLDPQKNESVHGVLSCKIDFGNFASHHKMISKYSEGKIHWMYTVEDSDGFISTTFKGVCLTHQDYDAVVDVLNKNIQTINSWSKLEPAKPVFRDLDGTLIRSMPFPEIFSN